MSAMSVSGSEVRISSLVIRRREVVEYLQRFPDEAREDQLLKAIDIGVFCLERASAIQDTEFVRRQIESLLHQVETMVSRVPHDTEKALLEKIGTGDGQVLAPIKQAATETAQAAERKIQEVRTLLDQDLDPGKQTSTLGKALLALRDLLDPKRNDSIQGHLHEAVRNITKADGDLASAVKTVVADAVRPLAENVNQLAKDIHAKQAADEITQHTTLKGYEFEDEVVGRIREWAGLDGIEVELVGTDNQPGDVLVKVNSDAAAPALTIVVEAKDRGAAVGRKQITEAIDQAMDKRNATCGIWVSRSRSGFAKEIGEWAEGQCSRGRWLACTFDMLKVALRFTLVQERLVVLRAAQPEVDATSITPQLQRIRTSLLKITNITRKVSEVRASAQEIQDEAEDLRNDIKAALTDIEEALRVISPARNAASQQQCPTVSL